MEGKIITLDNLTQYDQNIKEYTKNYTDEKHQEAIEVAEGKTATYVLSANDSNVTSSDYNYLFASDDEFIGSENENGTLLLVDGKRISLSSLKLGDIVLVIETTVADRFVSSTIDSSNGLILHNLEVRKIDLTPYALQSSLNALSTQTTTNLNNKVNKTTTVNGHALSSDVTVTKSDVGLGNVLNVASYSKTETDNLLSAKAASSTLTSHTGNKSNPHGVTKSQVGLSNVPNVNFLQISSKDYTPVKDAGEKYIFNITKMKDWGVYLFSITFEDDKENRVVQTAEIYMRDANEAGYYLSTPFYYYDGKAWEMCMLFCWRDNGVTIELRSLSNMTTQKSFDMYTLLRVKELQQG